jgi:hypothetical protein
VESRVRSDGGQVSYQVLTRVLSTDPLPDVPDKDDRSIRLALLYFRPLSSLTMGLLKESCRGEGWELSLAVLPRLALLRSGPPETSRRPSGSRTTYPMVGGILARGHEAGWFTFEVMGRGVGTILSVRLDRFAPSLLGDGSSRVRRVLYLHAQSRAHRLLLTRFLRRAAAIGVWTVGARPSAAG